MSSSSMSELNKYVRIFLVFLFIISLFLFSESLGRSLFVLLSLLLYLVLYKYTKNGIQSSLLYILIVLPFNITYQLPEVVSIFNTTFQISDPYVNGVYVNYLVPTFSILDIGLVFLVLSSLGGKRILLKEIVREYKWYLVAPLLYLFVQSIILGEVSVLFAGMRIFLFVLSFLILLKEKKNIFVGVKTAYILIINVLIQGSIGIIQFIKGSSLGLTFLGESQVVAGMQGSSFVDLGGEAFLRAYGTFPHPNVLAGFFVLTFFVGAYLFKKKERRYIGLVLSILSFLFLLFTFSRVSILILVVSSAILIVSFCMRRFKGVLFSFSPILLIQRFENIFNGGDSGFSDRVLLLKAGWRIFKENFVWGTGVGSFVRGMEEFVPRTSSGILLLQPVHSVVVLFLSEVGVVGFVLWGFLLVRVFWKNIGKVSLFGGLVLGSIVLIGLFDHYPISLPQGLGISLLFFLLFFRESKELY